MEDKNPYTGILDCMGAEAGKKQINNLAIGIVKRASPLVIQTTTGIELEKDELMVNADLQKDYKRDVSLSGQICEVTGYSGSMTYRTRLLKAGDTVLMLTADNQRFYVMCKLEAPK